MIGRFVPFVRTYVTLVAGVSEMPRVKFWLWSLIGAVLWVDGDHAAPATSSAARSRASARSSTW